MGKDPKPGRATTFVGDCTVFLKSLGEARATLREIKGGNRKACAQERRPQGIWKNRHIRNAREECNAIKSPRVGKKGDKPLRKGKSPIVNERK